MSAPVNPIDRFRQAPPGFWTRAENRHAFLDWLGHDLGFRRPRDWYQLKAKHLTDRGATVLLRWCGNSLVRLLDDYLPEHDWKAWLFPRIPWGFWDERANRVAFLDWLGEQLGYQEPEDWYQIENAVLCEQGAAQMIKRVGGAYPMMKDYMPDYDWKPWHFRKVPPGYWEVRENRLTYLRWLGGELGFKRPDDWYGLTVSDVLETGGATLLGQLGSVARLVTAHFPEHEWLEWRFEVNLNRFWQDEDNCRRYLSWLGEKLGFEEPDDWYALTYAALSKHRGGTLYAKLGSVRAIVEFLYPDREWLEWRFHSVGDGFWFDPKCRRDYLDWLATELDFHKMEDWYALTYEDLAANYGSTLSSVYGGRLYLIVMENYPEHEWLEWRFFKTSDGFWEKRENCLRYLDWLADRLGFSRVEDWYRVTSQDFTKNYGRSLLRKYGASFSAVLKFCYPDHEWKEWLFDKVPVDFWNEESNCLRYLDWLAGELGIGTLEEWYQVTSATFSRHRGYVLIRKWGGPFGILSHFYPDHDWKEWYFLHVPPGFWDDPRCRRRYLDWLGRKLGYRRTEDWYQLTRQQLVDNRGGRLAYKLGGTAEILREYRPDYDWKEWLLPLVPKGFWRNREARRRYLSWLGEKLGYRSPRDWCQLTAGHIDRSCGQTLLKTYSYSVDSILRSAFPADHPIVVARRRLLDRFRHGQP